MIYEYNTKKQLSLAVSYHFFIVLILLLFYSLMYSLRAMYGTDKTMNAMHGADSGERAARWVLKN